jgi:diamine N-acetyltransferase
MFHQLYADVLSNNPGSVALFESAGFEQCGLRKDWVKHPGGYYDLVVLQRILDSNGAE